MISRAFAGFSAAVLLRVTTFTPQPAIAVYQSPFSATAASTLPPKQATGAYMRIQSISSN